MAAYRLIPFLILGGAPDSFSKLRPFLLSGSLVSMFLGLYQVWRAERSTSPASDISVAVFWFSVIVVLGMILFPQAIANFLATHFSG